MKIAIIGLGLIGGSLAKALKKYTDHDVAGWDKDYETLAAAFSDGAVSKEANDDFLRVADVVFVALPPVAAIDFLLSRKKDFKFGAVAADVSGVKEAIHREVYSALEEEGVVYLGAHPMAGRETSGYRASDAELFLSASFIVTPTERRQEEAVEVLRTLAYEIGCACVTVTTPARHDRVIAYTSQLAHVVSNAYVKSETITERRGFSAGSFQDLTRVARLDENLWTDLMMRNRDPLLQELDTLITHLSEYRTALAGGDGQALKELLKDGKNIKLMDLKRNKSE